MLPEEGQTNNCAFPWWLPGLASSKRSESSKGVLEHPLALHADICPLFNKWVWQLGPFFWVA